MKSQHKGPIASAVLFGLSLFGSADTAGHANPHLLTQLRGINPAAISDMEFASKRSYQVLFSFCNKMLQLPVGGEPLSALVNVNGTLYGTAIDGVNGSSAGSVYALTSSGAASLTYPFKGPPPDGAMPDAGLIEVNDYLYGTTLVGGASNNGTVFKISLKTGEETVLHSFKGYPFDGSQPYAALTYLDGTLYGTTINGGRNSLGTVFAITPAGKEHVLYSFQQTAQNGAPDGYFPYASLLNVNGVLYGTTRVGGLGGVGTIFSITTTGTETPIYAFTGNGDANYPFAALIEINGALYGTSTAGGAYGEGTVFMANIPPKGQTAVEHVLHNFSGSGGDGAQPYGGVLAVGGDLYGTTSAGGVSSGTTGTIFKLPIAGGPICIVHEFQKASPFDGADPQAALINVNGTLYGTTEVGGLGLASGTVFSLVPQPGCHTT